MLDIIAVTGVIVLICLGIYGWIRSSHDNWSPRSGGQLDRNAKILGCETNRYNRYKFQTTVVFSDGFRYRSYDTEKTDNSPFKTTLRVTPEMKKKIIKKAAAKHDELIDRA